MQTDFTGRASLVGVNYAGYDYANAAVTDGRTLPWLQDDTDTNAWGLWGVSYRDVVILDPEGRYWSTYNLSDHDLAVASNRSTLAGLLEDAIAGKAPPDGK